MFISRISAISSDCPLRLTNVSYNQELPSNLARVLEEYLQGSSATYTKIEGQIKLIPSSGFKICILGCVPDSKDSETIFSLIDEISDVKTFHVVKPLNEIDSYNFFIPKTAGKVQIFTASKFKDGTISQVSCYELLVIHEQVILPSLMHE